MSLREDCSRESCRHDKDSHYRDVEATGDANQRRRVVYRACLAPFCDCDSYEPPTK